MKNYEISKKLKDLAVYERPQERMERFGASALSDTELLAMLLRSGSREMDVLTLAANLIRDAGSFSGLLNWTDAEFRRHPGIGKVKAAQLLAVFEVAKRILDRNQSEVPVFSDADQVFDYFRPLTIGLEVEKFWILCLNRKNRLIKRLEVTSGTANSSLVHPRETFREAIRCSASAVIAVHNHPSGDPAPSQADIAVTRQLREASKVIGIELIDHIIVGHPQTDPNGIGYYSFQASGFL